MHGLIFETSIYYWQDQPDNYPDGTTTNTARVRTVLLPAAPHRKRPQGPPFVSKVFTVRARAGRCLQRTSTARAPRLFSRPSRTLGQRIHELRQPAGHQSGIATVTASSVSSLPAPILPMQIHIRTTSTHSVTIQTVPEPCDRTHTQRRPFFNAIQKPAQSEIRRQPNGKPCHYSK
jgi:hypothetical protein